MNQLKCNTINCQHNLKSHCNAGVVMFDEKAQCQSKIKRAGGALEQTFAELEASDEFLQDAPMTVQCKAECQYNNNNRCSASSIFIQDSMMRTKCKTRLK